MLDKINKRESIIAKLIANTKRKKRQDNLVETARQIRWLENDMGGLKNVSKTIGISLDQIRQFLSVERLSPEVRKLVENRQIDLVNTVHYMRNFDAEAQQRIANEVIKGKLNASDIRVLAPLINSLKSTNIEQLISRVQNTRNKKVYVINFRTVEGVNYQEDLRGRFEKIIGIDGIESFEIKDNIGILEVSQVGKVRLQAAVKKAKISLRAFINRVIKE